MIRIKNADGTWSIADRPGVVSYTQETEPTDAVTGDFWCTEESDNLIQRMYDAIYPTGMIVFQMQKPNVPTGVTATWEDVSADYDGKALWVSSSEAAGTTLDGSLPDIEGEITSANFVYKSSQTVESGALYFGDHISGGFQGGGSNSTGIKFQASKSNDVYSASAGTNVVRPTSITIKVYKRTA